MTNTTNLKDFTYCLKIKKDGAIEECNCTNVARGYRQSWFKTPKAAKKGLEQAKRLYTSLGYEIVEAYCYTRSGKHFG